MRLSASDTRETKSTHRDQAARCNC